MLCVPRTRPAPLPPTLAEPLPGIPREIAAANDDAAYTERVPHERAGNPAAAFAATWGRGSVSADAFVNAVDPPCGSTDVR